MTGRFFEQFIEDYYAECDEHLALARRVLLELERGAGRTVPEAKSLHELFRSLHTLKGLSGMVGLQSAERVAHVLEGALRAVQRQPRPLDPALVDALFAGVDLLERCVAARRSGGEAPTVDAFVAELARVAPAGISTDPDDRPAASAPPPARAPSAASAQPATAAPDDGPLHHFEFTPSRELTQRGVGVEVVRGRLQALGTILEASPRVVGGGVVFDFWVAVRPDAAPDPAWDADGLRWSVASVPEADGAQPAPGPEVVAHTPHTLAAGANVVRVDLARIDDVIRLVGELVNSRGRLDDVVRQVESGARGAAVTDALLEINAAFERQIRHLREGMMRIRLVPVGEVFERLRFAVRDIAREAGKRVVIDLRGQETAVDKLVVDRMLEPLLHLVRNAVSHGLETPEERRARGKPEEGRLALRAAASGDRIVIEVEDDGAGVDPERVAARARARGLLPPGGALAPDALLDVLCAPGFSTRDEADMTSGRGVGMDVVRSAVRALGGDLALDSTPGLGTRFTIELPLTLMIVDALLVEIGGQQMAVPQPVLREVVRVEADAVTGFERNDVIAYRGGILPLLSLRRLFNLPDERRDVLHLLVVGTDASPTGLVVDRLLGLREIVVHPVNDPLIAMPGVGGATELGDGRVSLVLDSAALVRLARERRELREPVVA